MICTSSLNGRKPIMIKLIPVSYTHLDVYKRQRLDSVVVSCQHTEDKNLKKLEAEIRKKVLLPALRLLPQMCIRDRNDGL